MISGDKSPTPGIFAILADVGHDTMHKAAVLDEKADEETKEKLRKGDTLSLKSDKGSIHVLDDLGLALGLILDVGKEAGFYRNFKVLNSR